MRLGKTICSLGVDSRLEVSGRALAEFYPNWIFGCHGREIASIIGLGRSLHSDVLSLSLLDRSKPSLLEEPLSKRSLVAVSRGDHTWQLEFPEIPPATWNVTSHPNAFEEIRIEAGETHSGDVVRALVAEGLDEQGGIYFAPSSFVANSNPKSQISLRRARFAQVFDKAQQPWTLVANIPSSPTWIHLRGLSLQVNDKDGRPPFELLAASKTSQAEVRFDPNVSHAAFPIEGALSRPAP